MVRGDTCVGVRVGCLRVASADTAHETWLQSFCVHHGAFCVSHVSNMEACGGEGVSILFLRRQTAGSTAA